MVRYLCVFLLRCLYVFFLLEFFSARWRMFVWVFFLMFVWVFFSASMFVWVFFCSMFVWVFASKCVWVFYFDTCVSFQLYRVVSFSVLFVPQFVWFFSMSWFWASFLPILYDLYSSSKGKWYRWFIISHRKESRNLVRSEKWRKTSRTPSRSSKSPVCSFLYLK